MRRTRVLDDEVFEFQQFTIHQGHAAMKVGTDSDLLGALSAGGNRVLDIGTGTGVLALMMAQRYPEARVTAVEIDDLAVLDAARNFSESRFADRIELVHASFQDFLSNCEAGGSAQFDAVVCNPPYFERSLECPSESRTRARHTSSLPFSVLIFGSYRLLNDGGSLSVCIPPEVMDDFLAQCRQTGFYLQHLYKIKTVPEKQPKRFILICRKGKEQETTEHVFCMRNSDRTRSEWYRALMQDFLICGEL